MESAGHAFEMAASLREIAETAQLGLVFKTSFDKANRTAAAGRRGLGLEEALPVFAEIRAKLGIPVTTDVHEAWQCAEVAVRDVSATVTTEQRTTPKLRR